MKKEKNVRAYQRRTKSGKMITVRAHKASYDAAEEMRKAIAKKEGAGSELSKRKAVVDESPLGFSADEFKAWYHWDTENDPKNKTALKVEKALKKSMGAKAYKKFYDEMTDGYSARGHNKAFKSLGERIESSKVENPRNSARADMPTKKNSGGKVTPSLAIQIAQQRQYLAHLKKNGTAKDPAHKEYWEAEKQILDDMQKGGTPKSGRDLKAAEDAAIKKHGLTYEEDGMYSDKKGRAYRLSTHPFTGEVKVIPLKGKVMFATDAQLRKAGMKGDDYTSVDRSKLQSIVWGSPERSKSESSASKKEQTTNAKESKDKSETPGMDIYKKITAGRGKRFAPRGREAQEYKKGLIEAGWTSQRVKDSYGNSTTVLSSPDGKKHVSVLTGFVGGTTIAPAGKDIIKALKAKS